MNVNTEVSKEQFPLPQWAELAIEATKEVLRRRAAQQNLLLDEYIDYNVGLIQLIEQELSNHKSSDRISTVTKYKYAFTRLKIAETLIRATCSRGIENKPLRSPQGDGGTPTKAFFIGILNCIALVTEPGMTVGDFARLGAEARHAETYALREEVMLYWEECIAPELSNDKAANILLEIFPLSHRKLAEYVSAAKKDLRLRSAGKT